MSLNQKDHPVNPIVQHTNLPNRLAASDADFPNWDSMNFGPNVENPDTNVPSTEADRLK